MGERMTIKNPHGANYRIPANKARTMRIEWQQEIPVYYGTAVDRLGKYEDLGTLQELAELKERYSGTKR